MLYRSMKAREFGLRSQMSMRLRYRQVWNAKACTPTNEHVDAAQKRTPHKSTPLMAAPVKA